MTLEEKYKKINKELNLDYKGQFFNLGLRFRPGCFIELKKRLEPFELVDIFKIDNKSIAIARRAAYDGKLIQVHTRVLKSYISKVYAKYAHKLKDPSVADHICKDLIAGWGYDSCYQLLTISELKECLKK